MVFSDTVNNLGILEQTRSFARVDATQWPTYKVVNSCNNWHDQVTGYAIAADRNFQWDDTNHTKLPEGTTPLTINVSDYSFLTDEQSNPILTLLGVSRLEAGKYIPLTLIDRNDPTIDLANFGTVSGTPTKYDKIADNIIRLDRLPPATVAAGLKFYFQRAGSYFAATDTTKQPGVAPMLHRGYVIASAYDCALTLGLENLQPLSVEREKEEQKMIAYFNIRNNDETRRVVPASENNR
jgi:hypothetical protein